MDINANYSEEDNPLSLKADFILSLCELVVGGKEGPLPVEKTVIEMCIRDSSIRQPIIHIPTMPTTAESLSYLSTKTR